MDDSWGFPLQQNGAVIAISRRKKESSAIIFKLSPLKISKERGSAYCHREENASFWKSSPFFSFKSPRPKAKEQLLNQKLLMQEENLLGSNLTLTLGVSYQSISNPFQPVSFYPIEAVVPIARVLRSLVGVLSAALAVDFFLTSSATSRGPVPQLI